MSDEEEERPSFGGIGFGRGGYTAGFAQAGTSAMDVDENEDEEENENGYESPRKRPRLGNAAGFRRAGPPTGGQTKSGVGGAFAARMMASMGWKEGEGLGTQGHGRLAPIDITLRPQGAGLGAVKEKSKQAKEEEKRAATLRGETLENSSDEERRRKKEAKAARKKAGPGAPTPARSRKPKYVTAEDVKADLEGLNVSDDVLRVVYDLSGNRTENLGATSGFVAAQTPTDPAEVEAQKASRLIEREIFACAETQRGLNDRKTYLDDTTASLVDQIDQAREEVETSKKIITAIESLSAIDSNGAKANDLNETITELTHKLEALQVECKDYLHGFDLPEVAVAALHPLFRSSMQQWDPNEEPTYLTKHLTRLKSILGIETHDGTAVIARHEGLDQTTHRSKRSTTHFETMIYQLWLPRVRSAVTNELNVDEPQPFIDLLSAWRPLLPLFVYSSLMNQSIVPKLESAVRNWKPSRSGKHRRPSPDETIFPWLPYLPERQLDLDDSSSLISEVRRKLRSQLSSYDLKGGVPLWLTPWRTLMGSAYTKLLVSHLLPRLAAHLAQNLVIDPSNQNMDPFEMVLSFASLFSTSTMAQLLVAEFFPKFLGMLHQWLTSDEAKFNEISEWFSWWKEQVPEAVRDSPMVYLQWNKASNMMDEAAELGDDVGALAPPSPSAGATGASASSRPTQPVDTRTAADADESTFREVVEDWCAENDLLFVAQRDAHPQSGAPLFRITARADMKGGVVVYLGNDDALHVKPGPKDGGRWQPITLGDQLVARAEGR